MLIAHEPTPKKPLRLWPGVVTVVLQWLPWLVLPMVAPEAVIYAMMAGALGGPVIIVWWLFWRGAARSLWLTLALGLITAGTLGNLYDRLGMHGYLNPETGQPWKAVRDFLHFQLGALNWQVFGGPPGYSEGGKIPLSLPGILAAAR